MRPRNRKRVMKMTSKLYRQLLRPRRFPFSVFVLDAPARRPAEVVLRFVAQERAFEIGPVGRQSRKIGIEFFESFSDRLKTGDVGTGEVVRLAAGAEIFQGENVRPGGIG